MHLTAASGVKNRSGLEEAAVEVCLLFLTFPVAEGRCTVRSLWLDLADRSAIQPSTAARQLYI